MLETRCSRENGLTRDVCACGETALAIGVLGLRREKQDPYVTRLRPRAKVSAERDPAPSGKSPIENDQIRGLARMTSSASSALAAAVTAKPSASRL